MKILACVSLLFSLLACEDQQRTTVEVEIKKKPNIVLIYLDDLGYGDIGAYGATEIKTPNIDAIARGGLRFTDGYATSATCTPSRYALLTGMYPWRNKKAKVLPGTASLLIDTTQITLPKMLQQHGYHTAVVGKWHLGLGSGQVDWNRHISPGPREVGFEYSYIMAATQDRVPTVYIHNGNVDGLSPQDPLEVSYQKNFDGELTGKDHPELLTMKWHFGHYNSIVNGISRIGFMKGGTSAKWRDIDMADHFLDKAKTYVKEHKSQAFFLYYALQQPHVPRTPHPRFVGSSRLGSRGDAIVEADWCIGELMKSLEEEGLLENTLVILSSDNGPVLDDGYYDDAVEKLGRHTPSGSLRGGKYSLFDAGTRVPFITYWKGVIQPGVSEAIVCQMDLLSSLAVLHGEDRLYADSQNMLNTLLGKSNLGRAELILEANSKTCIRRGDWVMIPPYKGPEVYVSEHIESGLFPDFQLYNFKEDLGQKNNLAKSHPEKLQEMILEYQKIRGQAPENPESLKEN